MAETTLLSLRPTRLMGLAWYVLWLIMWILTAVILVDPMGLIPDDWRFLGFRAQSYLGWILGLVGLFALLRAELKRLSVKYVVMDTRVIRFDGIVSRRMQEMPFTKIERIEINQGLVQRIFRFGDIIIDTGEDQVVLASVGHVHLIQGEISKLMATFARRT